MTSLTDFLLQRLAEDEAFVQAGLRLRESVSWNGLTMRQEAHAGNLFDVVLDDTELVEMVSRFVESGVRSPMEAERVLADVEAKRRIVELHSPPKGYQAPPWGPEDAEPPRYEPDPWEADQCASCGYSEEWQASEYGATYPCSTLRLLAQPYRSHPEFDEAWAQ